MSTPARHMIHGLHVRRIGPGMVALPVRSFGSFFRSIDDEPGEVVTVASSL
ncbi:MAG: hypothetical protein RBU30_07520 [Polyangia bacterium]|nr:hypothetical protein [Polyangia bacterium]